MNELSNNMHDKMRRSLGLEFVRLEDDFDDTREKRAKLANKLVSVAETVKLVDANDDGTTTVREDTAVGISLMTSALKALSDTEKAAVTAINTKLRHSEQEAANNALHQNRIAVVLAATRPGALNNDMFEPEALEHSLEQLFDADVKDFELKTNPYSLDDKRDS